MEHLAYCDAKAKVLSKILDGTKTMIIRGAAGRKLPYGRVFEGETLYFIENNGDGLIKAKATVKSVFNSDKMTKEQSIEVVDNHQDKLNLSNAQTKRWAGKKYLCLVEIENVSPIEPFILDRQKNMDDWITVEDINSIIKKDDNTMTEYKAVRFTDK
ncbi:hypothetical protein [Oceanirhabdus seepicola]|uniref:ASCH domain-containing protein n=1 Tax=Oceanirhabdus seepicola TaxID=2828781 RepID=A0A9J6NX55_9CLOT|nr:hypothetical protein [Oceanirhabdus seepicola]MCM1988205.1 hypothetical protein [Oceanirhabdus seepicola]